MNIDFKKAVLESQQRLVHLAEIEAQLKDLPGHLRALVPHLDAIEQVGNRIHAVDAATRQYIPEGISLELSYIRRNIADLRATLVRNGNPLIELIESTEPHRQGLTAL